MVFSLLRGASPWKEKAKIQPLMLRCCESSYSRVSATGGRIGFSAKYFLNGEKNNGLYFLITEICFLMQEREKNGSGALITKEGTC
jgi:hypothetical protein